MRLLLRSVVLVVVVVLAGSGCSSGSSSSGGTASGGGNTPAAKLFPDDFESVCQGATISKAKPYDKAAKTHKAIYFATYKEDLLDQSTQLPADWTVTFDANTDAYASVDLVACAVRTSAAFVKECDGYEKDDKPTNNKVKLHTATYDVTVREATTGKELAKTELAGTSETCPMLQSFDGEDEVVDAYAPPPKDDVVAFVKPFVQPA